MIQMCQSYARNGRDNKINEMTSSAVRMLRAVIGSASEERRKVRDPGVPLV